MHWKNQLFCTISNLLWLFTNVLMSVGRKVGGKKNKFFVGNVNLVHLVFVFLVYFYAVFLEALHITFRGFAMVGQKKHKTSILHKS